MGESEILDMLYIEQGIEYWWEELLGQRSPTLEGFDIDLAIKSLPRTEVTASAEIHRKYKNILTYTERDKEWYIWDGRIHTPCVGEGIVVKITKIFYKAYVQALDFVKEYYDVEARKVESSGVDKCKEKGKAIRETYDKGEISKHKQFRNRLSTEAGMAALVRMLKTDCDVPADYYDNDQQWFVIRDYVIDLHELVQGVPGCIKAHDPSRPVTRYFDAEYDWSKNLGHWDRYLETSIPDESMRNYLKKVTGASFMGRSKLRTIINLAGPPGSGKSLFLDTFFALGNNGSGYSCLPDSKAAIRVSGTNFEQDSTRSKRFIGISEPSDKEEFDDDFFKKFTGDTWVETRTLNTKSSGSIPQGVPFIASNNTLRINTRDKAIRNRVQTIQFPNSFEVNSAHNRSIEGIEQLLLDDSARVLTWLIEGMKDFIEDKMVLNPPQSVVELQQAHANTNSTALRWLEEAIEEKYVTVDVYAKTVKYSLDVKEAYNVYKKWIMDVGERRALTLKYFKEDIEKEYEKVVRDEITGSLKFPSLMSTDKFNRLVNPSAIFRQ